MLDFKRKVYKIVEKGDHGGRGNQIFDYFIMSLIALNIVAIILESVSEVSAGFSEYFLYFNYFSIIIFTIEYVFRLYISDLTHPSSNKVKSMMKFIFSFYGLVDLLAILPFFLPFFIKVDLRFLRVLRLSRFLRVLKINRYNDSLSIVGAVMKEKKAELMVTGFVTLLLLLFASFLMYYVEGEAQPEIFPNILASFWWAVATLTTVGYGDVYPITAMGKIISGVIALMGIGVVALPTGIISSGFISKIEKKESTKCPHCNKDIAD